jgi:uncharacterized metal-binding protein (TIGR02443 family)
MSESPIIIKKQFIAGAVCPECDQVDRIVVEVATAKEGVEISRRRCVACGFADPFVEQTAQGMQVIPRGIPKGRPERAKTSSVNPVQIRILDPKDPSL